MFGKVYDADEGYLADIVFSCKCLSADINVNSLTANSAYSSDGAKNGTFSEIFVSQSATFPVDHVLRPGSFVLYRDVFADGSDLNKFFGRASNGSVGWLQNVPNDSR